jgi:hypothetical protein
VTDLELDSEVAGSLTDYNSWRPHPKQVSALQVPDTIFEVLYGGALGGGKTDWLLSIPIVKRTIDDRCQLYQHPHFKGIIFRRKYTELDKEVIPRAKYWYGRILGAKYNETKHLFLFPSGAMMFLSHMEREENVFDHDTNEYNYVGIDQAEQFTQFQLQYISSRIRSARRDLPKIYRLSANPGGESHVYLRDRFVTPSPQGNQIIYDKTTRTKRIFIPAKLEDNPSLIRNDPEYRNRLELLPENEKKAKIDGDWFAFSGQVFSEIRLRKILGEPENAIHVIPSFTIPDWWPRILAIDWGFKAHTVGLWGAISPDLRLFIYRHYRVNKTNISAWASDIKRLSQYEVIRTVVLDPSAWHQRGDEKTIAEQFNSWSSFIPKKADNDRLGGKQLLHDFLRWKPKPPKYIPPEGFNFEKAHSILRNYGPAAYQNYMDAFKPELPEKNIPRLQWFEGCKANAEVIAICQYDDKNPRKREDVMEFDGDDDYDCVRYLIKEVDNFFNEVRLNKQKFDMHSKIMDKFAGSGDYFQLDMEMRLYEERVKNLGPHPVKRYN